MNALNGLTHSIRVSGKPGFKKPVLMIGDTFSGEFTSSGQAKDELSLHRWGFRITVRPIYGIK